MPASPSTALRSIGKLCRRSTIDAEGCRGVFGRSGVLAQNYLSALKLIEDTRESYARRTRRKGARYVSIVPRLRMTTLPRRGDFYEQPARKCANNLTNGGYSCLGQASYIPF